MIPAAFLQIGRHVTSAHEEEIATTDFNTLRRCSAFEVLDRNGIAWLQKRHALVPWYIEQHATSHNFIFRFVDAVLAGTATGDKHGVVAIVHLSGIEDAGEAVPLCDALQRHDDPVV